MRAVVLAGGRGTRLRPYTTVFPKPMVPVGEHPVLEIILRKLVRERFDDVTLSVGYLAPLIRSYFDLARPGLEGLRLSYVEEQEPTGTAGALRLLDRPEGAFLMMNGDVLTTMPLRPLIERHRSTGAALTIATHARAVHVDLGVLESDGDGRVVSYTEKPTLRYRVSMGVYVLDPSVIDLVPVGRHFDFPDLVHALLEGGRRVQTHETDDLWLDVGRHEDYEEAERLVRENAEAFGLG